MNKSPENRNSHRLRFCLLASLAFLSIVAGESRATHYAVASAHPLATEAGMEVMENGGNAFDAAIAVTSVLGVVEPYSSGIGGGGFYLLYVKKDDRYVMLDARERAPLRAHRDMFLGADGKVDPDLSRNGALAAGIPGIPAAFDHLQTYYGSIPLPVLLWRAIDYAQEGFLLDKQYVRMARFRFDVLNRYPSSRNVLLQNGQVPVLGARLRQPDLARTLKTIAFKGSKEFYRGALAAKLVSSVRAHGGLWSLQDLNQYQLIEREPVRIRYRDSEIVTASLPSSGGIVLGSIFNMLEVLGYESAGPTARAHQIVEAIRRAYRDRAEFLGDSDYEAVPVNNLLSPGHARRLLDSFSPQNATPSNSLPGIASLDGGQDTTHFSIVDADGNMVSATLSINYPFGSGLIADGTGVLLNDEMDDFSASPGVPNAYGLLGSDANAIEPGKRMLSSMSPSIVLNPARTLISGTPGGSRIITMQLLGILAFLEGESVESIVSRPRFHHQYFPDQITHEKNALDISVMRDLKARGHQLKENSNYGNMQAIVVDNDSGKITAASDPRGIGLARVAPKPFHDGDRR